MANSKRSSKEALELIFKAIGTPTPAAAASSNTVTIIHQWRVESSIPANKATRSLANPIYKRNFYRYRIS